VEGDIKACFDEISHSALLNRIRVRIGDKRVLALVKAFLKAGILTEDGTLADTQTGTPQGGILSPVIANVALSVLDEHFVASRLNHEDGPSVGAVVCPTTGSSGTRTYVEFNISRIMSNTGLCRVCGEGAGQRRLMRSGTRHNPGRMSEVSSSDRTFRAGGHDDRPPGVEASQPDLPSP
jgi:Reverse transcriptase (RNA-dependent DNA polymerase)